MAKKSLGLLLILALSLFLISCGSSKDSVANQLLSIDGKALQVHLEERLSISKKIDGESWNMQGGDNDGNFGYFAVNNGDVDSKSLTRIYKIDLSTWQIVKISGDLALGHANDVTYMAKDHQLIITWCEADNYDRATVVDAETLEIVSEMRFPITHSVMTYCAETGRYILGNTGDICDLEVYDENLTHISTIDFKYNFAKQGLACDDKLIYHVLSPWSAGDNDYIFVFTHDGDLLHSIIYPMPYESENISVYNDRLILAVNDHHDKKTMRFYEMTFSEK